MADIPPLKPLHSESSLSAAKLAKLELLSNDQLKNSLLPGKKECLKAKTNGLILDGHHRILDAELSHGENAVVHCRQGVGRSGLIAACLLISKGRSPGAALTELSQTRGLNIPETREQRKWIERFATVLANSK
jgi:protein tyrosine/serine phosphatase